MLTEEQIQDMYEKLEKAGVLARGDRFLHPDAQGKVSLDIRGQFTTMDANLLYCLTQTFVTQVR